MDLITKAEQEQLQARLAELKGNRLALSARIAEARALGDLSENAEYHAAREQQGLEEAEIKRLEGRLSSAQMIDESRTADTGVVFLGSTVKLREVDSGDEDLYKLVGEMSNSPSMDVFEVTVNSPMGEALMKARIGEIVRVKAPRGIKAFEVVEIV